MCFIDEPVLNWGEHISHLYYDQDAVVEVVAFRLLDAINNSTGSQWGTEHVNWYNVLDNVSIQHYYGDTLCEWPQSIKW